MVWSVGAEAPHWNGVKEQRVKQGEHVEITCTVLGVNMFDVVRVHQYVSTKIATQFFLCKLQ